MSPAVLTAVIWIRLSASLYGVCWGSHVENEHAFGINDNFNEYLLNIKDAQRIVFLASLMSRTRNESVNNN